ncbi:MAG: helix-turn-helix transcriptional regulator [Clostridia bacterium]|nr:helix-turn-helix transcriptional regulator [Clostridia bacterium]
MNFNSALNQMRCSQAAMMIRREHKTISEIAYATGFGSIRSFNRAFMEVYKTTPNEFRKTIKK